MEYLQNPIIFAIAMGVFVALYVFFEDSLQDKPILSKTKYIRAFIVTAIGINVVQTYANKSSVSSGMNGGNIYNQSFLVGNAPF